MKYEVNYNTCKFLAEIKEFSWATCLIDFSEDEELEKVIPLDKKIKDFESIILTKFDTQGFYTGSTTRAKKNPLRLLLDRFVNTHKELLLNPFIRNLYIGLTHTFIFAGFNAVNPHKAYQKTCELANKFFTSEEKIYIHEVYQKAPQTDLHTIEFADEMWNQLKGANI